MTHEFNLRMHFSTFKVFFILDLVKRKLGLSGRNTRRNAAEKAGNVHKMMYSRHEVRWILPNTYTYTCTDTCTWDVHFILDHDYYHFLCKGYAGFSAQQGYPLQLHIMVLTNLFLPHPLSPNIALYPQSLYLLHSTGFTSLSLWIWITSLSFKLIHPSHHWIYHFPAQQGYPL